jgi:hypothetical protein
MMHANHLVHAEIAGPQPSPGFLLTPFGWAASAARNRCIAGARVSAAERVAAMMRANRSLFADLFVIDRAKSSIRSWVKLRSVSGEC